MPLHSAWGGMKRNERRSCARLIYKADLVTEMVGEFPELQGTMARVYAQADGEDAGVAKALKNTLGRLPYPSYLPSSALAGLPMTMRINSIPWRVILPSG